MTQNKVTFGLQSVHIAFKSGSSWEAPITIPGVVRWTPSTVGEASTFYADNTAYFVITANNGYTGELEIANIPDAIQARMHGWEIDANGMLVEVTDGIPEHFALLGQVQGDQRNRRFVYYDCVASRPAKERTTKGESVEPSTDVLAMTVSPIEIGGKTVVKGDLELSDTNSAAYNSFFSAVTLPTFGAVNKSNLSATIALAGSLTQATYTTESWSDMQAALTTATAVNGDTNAVQAQVDSADRALEDAIVGLVVA